MRAKSRSSPWKHKREAEGCAGPLPPGGTGAAVSTRASFGSPPWSTPQVSAAARRAPSPAATKALSVLRIAGVSVEEPMPWRLQEISGALRGATGPGSKFRVHTSKAPAPPGPRYLGTPRGAVTGTKAPVTVPAYRHRRARPSSGRLVDFGVLRMEDVFRDEG